MQPVSRTAVSIAAGIAKGTKATPGRMSHSVEPQAAASEGHECDLWTKRRPIPRGHQSLLAAGTTTRAVAIARGPHGAATQMQMARIDCRHRQLPGLHGYQVDQLIRPDRSHCCDGATPDKALRFATATLL